MNIKFKPSKPIMVSNPVKKIESEEKEKSGNISSNNPNSNPQKRKLETDHDQIKHHPEQASKNPIEPIDSSVKKAKTEEEEKSNKPKVSEMFPTKKPVLMSKSTTDQQEKTSTSLSFGKGSENISKPSPFGLLASSASQSSFSTLLAKQEPSSSGKKRPKSKAETDESSDLSSDEQVAESEKRQKISGLSQPAHIPTGEENEKTVKKIYCELKIFHKDKDKASGVWKHRGEGLLHLNVGYSGATNVRLVMRTRGTLTLILNTPLINVSGSDDDDYDIETNGVIRRAGQKSIVFFGREVESATESVTEPNNSDTDSVEKTAASSPKSNLKIVMYALKMSSKDVAEEWMEYIKKAVRGGFDEGFSSSPSKYSSNYTSDYPTSNSNAASSDRAELKTSQDTATSSTENNASDYDSEDGDFDEFVPEKKS